MDINHRNVELLNSRLSSLTIPEGMGYQLPPNSSGTFNCVHIDYADRLELINQYVIDNAFANPQGTVQGGVIAACFDDTFGPLGVATARKPIVTIDLNVQYIRPITLNENFYIKANVVSVAKSTIFMQAEAIGAKGKILAKASTNQLIIR
jgi:uncharacterized protein (TIGR00369 family)